MKWVTHVNGIRERCASEMTNGAVFAFFVRFTETCARFDHAIFISRISKFERRQMSSY
jgi:hypothetical protein